MAPVKRNLTSALVPLIGPSVGDHEKPLPLTVPLVFGLKMVPSGGDLTTEQLSAKFERLAAPKMTSYLDFVLGPKGKLYALAKDRIDIFLPVAEVGLRKYDVSLVLPVVSASSTPLTNAKGYEWPKKIQVDDHGSIYVLSYPNGGKFFDAVIHDGNVVLRFTPDGKLGEHDLTLEGVAPPRNFGQNLAYSRAKKLTVFPTADRMNLRVLSGTGVEPRNIAAPLASSFDFDGTLDKQNANVVWYTNTGGRISGSGLAGEKLFDPIPAPYLSALRVSYSGDIFVLANGTIASLEENPEVDPISGLLIPKPEPVVVLPEVPVVETPVVAETEKIQEPAVSTEISEPEPAVEISTAEEIPGTEIDFRAVREAGSREGVEPVVLVSEIDPGFELPVEPSEILPLEVVSVPTELENSAPENPVRDENVREDEVEIDE